MTAPQIPLHSHGPRMGHGYHVEAGQPVSFDPAHKHAQIVWAEAVMASPAHLACDAMAKHACKILVALDRDHIRRARAADLLTLIDGETDD